MACTRSMPPPSRGKSNESDRTKKRRNVRKNRVGRRHDVAWQHATVVEDEPSKMKCNYCHKKCSGGAFRFKHHLAGTHKNIEACGAVPHEVRQQMLAIVRELERNHIIKRTPNDYIENIVDGGKRKKRMNASQVTRAKPKLTTKVCRSLMPKPSDLRRFQEKGSPLQNRMLSRKSTRPPAQPSTSTQHLRSDQVITKKEFEEFKKDCQDFWMYMKEVGEYQKNMGWSLADIDKESFPQFPNHILGTIQEKDATTSKTKAATSKGKEKEDVVAIEIHATTSLTIDEPSHPKPKNKKKSEKKKVKSEKKNETTGKKKMKGEKKKKKKKKNKTTKVVDPVMEETLEDKMEEERVLEEHADDQNEESPTEEVVEEEQVEVEDQVEKDPPKIQELEEEHSMKADKVAEEVTHKQPSKEKDQSTLELESIEIRKKDQVEELQDLSKEKANSARTDMEPPSPQQSQPTPNPKTEEVINVYKRKKWTRSTMLDKAIEDEVDLETRIKRKQAEIVGVENPMLVDDYESILTSEPNKKKTRISRRKSTKK